MFSIKVARFATTFSTPYTSKSYSLLSTQPSKHICKTLWNGKPSYNSDGSQNFHHRSDRSADHTFHDYSANFYFCSGYIGGHVVAPLQKVHPEYQLVALVRNENQAKVIQTAFPAIETVIGDLDSDNVLQAEAAKADVVLSKLSYFLREY